MANRRMFSKAVVCSGRFLKMPSDSQNLYFHLGMAADDDGVVEAWSVLRSTGSGEDNLKVLASKGFIKVLNEDLVSYILDWNEHNAMRSDRLTPSAYRELLVQVIPEVELVVPTERADRANRLGRPTDVPGSPQDRIGEGRINTPAIAEIVEISEREETPKSPGKYPHALEVFSWFPNRQKSWESMKNVQEREYAEYLYARTEEKVKQAIRFVEAHKDEEFCPKVTKPSDLEKKWLDIAEYAKRNR